MDPNPYRSPQLAEMRGQPRFRFRPTLVELLTILGMGGVMASLFLPAVESHCRPRSAPTVEEVLLAPPPLGEESTKLP